GHRFRGPRDAGPPAGTTEIEHRGYERARVRDSDPEDEVGDVDGPEDRRLVTGDAQAHLDLIPESIKCQREHRQRQTHASEIGQTRRLQPAKDVVVDAAEAHVLAGAPGGRTIFFRYV